MEGAPRCWMWWHDGCQGGDLGIVRCTFVLVGQGERVRIFGDKPEYSVCCMQLLRTRNAFGSGTANFEADVCLISPINNTDQKQAIGGEWILTGQGTGF